MSVLNRQTVTNEFIKRATTIISEDLKGSPNLLTDARILNAIAGDWFIPFDSQNTRWQKVDEIENKWVEFVADFVETFKVKASDSDADPDFLETKMDGTHGTHAQLFGDNQIIIDSRRTIQAYS